eukprot:363169-Chlamydomonas_euryale.AAC.43
MATPDAMQVAIPRHVTLFLYEFMDPSNDIVVGSKWLTELFWCSVEAAPMHDVQCGLKHASLLVFTSVQTDGSV